MWLVIAIVMTPKCEAIIVLHAWRVCCTVQPANCGKYSQAHQPLAVSLLTEIHVLNLLLFYFEI